jgi:hypothetical protein
VEDASFVLICGINDTLGVINTKHFSSKSVCSTGLVSTFTGRFELEMFMNFFFSGRLMGLNGES